MTSPPQTRRRPALRALFSRAARLCGLAFALTALALGLGTPLAAQASTEAPPEMMEILRLDGSTTFRVDRGERRKQAVRIHPGPPAELHFEFTDPSIREWGIITLRPQASLPATLAGRRLNLTLDASEATGVIGAAIRIRDSGGEIHQWSSRLRANEGRQTLGWTLNTGGRGYNSWGGERNRTLDGELVLMEIAIEVDTSVGAQGIVRISSLGLEVRPEDLAPAPRAEFVPARRTLYFTEAERGAAAIRLTNDGLGPLHAPLHAEIRAPGGRWMPWNLPAVRLAPNASEEFRFGDKVDRFGIWSWRIRIQGVEELFAGSFAFLELPGDLPPIDGIDLATTGVENFEDAQLARALGARTHRFGVNWHELSPSEGVYNWGRQDRIFDSTQAAGLRIQTGLGYSALWAAEGAPEDADWRRRMTYPPRLDAWRDYVRRTAERYRGRIFAYEVWNEPDLDGFFRGTTDHFIQMQRIAAEEIRRADPQALVMSGGFATVLNHGGRRLNPDLQARAIAETQDSFDLHALHQHGMFDSFYRALTGPLVEIRRTLREPRPLYFNETSVGTQFTDEEDQAKTLPKKFTFAASHGAVGYNWFLFRGRSNHTNHYAMVNMRNGEPRPVFVAYAALARELSGLRYDRRIDIGDGRFAFLFSGPQRQVIVAWAEAESAGDAVLLASLGEGAPRARSVDLMGNASPAATTPQGALFHISRSPSYFELSGAPAELRASLLVDVRDQIALSNPGSAPVSYRLGDREGRLSPGQSTAIETASDEEQVRLSLAGHSFDLRAPTRRTFWLNRDGLAPTPTLRLDQPAFVRNRFENDPLNEPRTWQGPSDHSADLWLGLKGDVLHVRVDVRDDTHHQHYSGWNLWRGDSVQVALANTSAGQRDDFWVLGAARRNDGEVEFFEWSRPAAAAALRTNPRHVVTPIAGGLRYEFELNLREMGLARALAENGLGFNLVVNDADNNIGTNERKGWLQLAEGLATRRDASNFPRLRVRR